MSWILGLAGGVCSSLWGCTTGDLLPPSADASLDATVSPSDAGESRHEFCGDAAPAELAPHTIADVVAWLNAAPKPVSLPCFVASLARPLDVYATNSVISAQPAGGRRSPRTFLFFEGLIASVVAEGPGSHLLEFGELRGPARTLKGEIEFPVTGALAQDAPFEQIMYDERMTDCAFCHAAELRDDTIPLARAFVSQALRPRLEERVPVAELDTTTAQCDAAAEPERCALLRSLFHGGAPRDRDFPAQFDTIVP